MPPKLLLLGHAGRKRLLEGARVLASAVRPTLGPAGRTVIIDRPMMTTPLPTKDGVTVAEEIELPDWFQNLGAQLVLETAVKTGWVAGDGTTTATVLAHAIYRECEKLVVAGYHPIDLKRGIEAATEQVVDALAKMAKEVKGKRDVTKIATISANGDAEIGKMIGDAVDKVGPEGIIHVEQGTGLRTTLEISEGVEIDCGFSSPYFITDKEKLIVELDNPYILLVQDKVNHVAQLVPILEKVKATGRALLAVVEATGDAMSLMVVNQLEGSMKVCAIMPPFYTDSRRNSLGDLAAQTGARVIVDDEPGISLANLTLEDLGRAKRVIVTQEKTTILSGAGDPKKVEARAKEIRALFEDTESTYMRQQLNERLRRLVGGAALIRVGGTTDPETRERKARVEDAMFATRAALEEGMVPGGGVALLRAAAGLTKLEKKLPEGQAAGVAIIRHISAVPCRSIAENAGEDGSQVLQRVLAGKGGFGYNAATGKYQDLVEAGVIDPTMVVRLALQNAVSIAVLLMTSEAFMVEAPRDPIATPEMGSSTDGLSMEPFLSRRRPRGA